MIASSVKDENVWEWFRPKVATIQVDSTLEVAVNRMRTLGVHHLIVMEGQAYLGMLDARDCVGVWSSQLKIVNLMRGDVPLIDEETEVKEVVRLVLERGFTALPLQNNGAICGILTTTDLIRLLENELNDEDASGFVEKGQDFMSGPVVQSLTRLLGNAGL